MANEQPEHPDILAWFDTAYENISGPECVWCEPAIGYETTLHYREGLILGGSWSPQFLRDTGDVLATPWTVTLKKLRLLLIEQAVQPIPDWMPLLENAQREVASLLVLTNHIEEELLRMLIVNAHRRVIESCVIWPGGSSRGDRSAILEQFGGYQQSLPATITDLPQAAEAWVRRDATVIFPTDTDQWADHLERVAILAVSGAHLDDQRERLRFAMRALV